MDDILLNSLVMGYMGLGMQKWIYTMRPRRPFSMKRKGSFTPVSGCKREFKLQNSKPTNELTISVIIILIIGLIVVSLLPKWKTYEHSRSMNEINALEIKDQQMFNFLLESGKDRFELQNYTGAYSEFKLAKAIYPENKEVNELILEVLSTLCFEKDKNCQDLDNL